MKASFLVSVCGSLAVLTASVAAAATVTTEFGRPLLVEARGPVTTEFGRPLLVEARAPAAVCSGVAVRSGTAVQGWQDALAGKRVTDLIVLASWHDALANKRVQERGIVLADADPSTDCALTY